MQRKPAGVKRRPFSDYYWWCDANDRWRRYRCKCCWVDYLPKDGEKWWWRNMDRCFIYSSEHIIPNELRPEAIQQDEVPGCSNYDSDSETEVLPPDSPSV